MESPRSTSNTEVVLYRHQKAAFWFPLFFAIAVVCIIAAPPALYMVIRGYISPVFRESIAFKLGTLVALFSVFGLILSIMGFVSYRVLTVTSLGIELTYRKRVEFYQWEEIAWTRYIKDKNIGRLELRACDGKKIVDILDRIPEFDKLQSIIERYVHGNKNPANQAGRLRQGRATAITMWVFSFAMLAGAVSLPMLVNTDGTNAKPPSGAKQIDPRVQLYVLPLLLAGFSVYTIVTGCFAWRGKVLKINNIWKLDFTVEDIGPRLK